MTPNDLPLWHVLGDQIREQTELAASGTGLRSFYEIPYQIDSGPAKGSIQKIAIDPRDFVPATVQERIEEHLANVHNVASLGKADV